MKTRKLTIIIAICIIVAIVIIAVIIPAVLLRQSDHLGIILYNCFFGFDRSGSLDAYIFDNGTHTIDENSCRWSKNRLP